MTYGLCKQFDRGSKMGAKTVTQRLRDACDGKPTDIQKLPTNMRLKLLEKSSVLDPDEPVPYVPVEQLAVQSFVVAVPEITKRLTFTVVQNSKRFVVDIDLPRVAR